MVLDAYTHYQTQMMIRHKQNIAWLSWGYCGRLIAYVYMSLVSSFFHALYLFLFPFFLLQFFFFILLCMSLRGRSCNDNDWDKRRTNTQQKAKYWFSWKMPLYARQQNWNFLLAGFVCITSNIVRQSERRMEQKFSGAAFVSISYCVCVRSYLWMHTSIHTNSQCVRIVWSSLREWLPMYLSYVIIRWEFSIF